MHAGKVVSIIEPSRKREAVVGVLLPVEAGLAACAPSGANPGPVAGAASAAVAAGTYQDCLMLFPLDPRLPKCIVGPKNLATLPQELKCALGAAVVVLCVCVCFRHCRALPVLVHVCLGCCRCVCEVGVRARTQLSGESV